MSTTGSPGETPGSPVIRARQLVGATSTSAATTVWLAILGFLTTPYMLHQLGASAYGVFALITIVSAYLSNLEFGFGHALVRFAARAHGVGDHVQERRVLETSLAVFSAAGLAAAGIAFVLAPRVVRSFSDVPQELQDQALTAVRLGAIILLFSLLSTFWTSALIGLGRLSIVVAIRAANGTLISASAVTTVALGGGLDAVLLVQLLVGSVSFCVLAASVVVTQGQWVLPRVHRPTFRAMARYSGFVFLGGLAYQLMLQGPPTVLAGHVDTAELATYTVPAIVMQQLMLLATSASLGFLPLASAESASTDRTRLAAIFGSHVRLTLLVMGPIAAYLVVFAEPVLATWIDEGFAAQAADPLRFLSGAALLIALGGPPADVARGLGRPAWIVVYGVAAGILEVSFALALVPDHGATGVAAAMCLGLMLATVPLLVIVARRLLDLHSGALASALAPVLGAVLATTGLYALGGTITDGVLGALMTGLLVTPAYVVVAYRTILHEHERRPFRRARHAT